MRYLWTILLALSPVHLSTASPIADVADISAASTKTLTSISFGFDPLEYAQSGGNEVLASVYNDVANAHTGRGYMSLSFPNTTDKRYLVLVYGFPLKSNTDFIARYWAKATKESVCYGQLSIRDQATQVTTNITTLLLTPKYKKLESVMSTGTVGKKDVGIAIMAITCNGAGAQQAYVDDFLMTSS